MQNIRSIEPVPNTLYIIGNGPHAREISHFARQTSDFETVLLGPEEEEKLPFGVTVALGLGSAKRRLAAFNKLKTDYVFQSLVHPSSEMPLDLKPPAGSYIAAGALISINCQLSPGILVNWHATIGHDVTVGEGSAIGPQAALSGGVRVGKGVQIGAGAIVLENVTIGDYAVIGAGAVVLNHVPSGETVVGVPAKPI